MHELLGVCVEFLKKDAPLPDAIATLLPRLVGSTDATSFFYRHFGQPRSSVASGGGGVDLNIR